jgi:hypothetical protein
LPKDRILSNALSLSKDLPKDNTRAYPTGATDATVGPTAEWCPSLTLGMLRKQSR